jgi:hypothetical protein
MIDGLGERIGDKVDPLVSEFGKRARAAFIARMQIKAVFVRALLAGDPILEQPVQQRG